jgi:hypothetical protein
VFFSLLPISAVSVSCVAFLERTAICLRLLASPCMKSTFLNWDTNLVTPHVSNEIARSIAASLKSEVN